MLIGFILFILAIAVSLAWLWAGGIDHMTNHHPDYKGDDWLNWDANEEDKEQIS